MTLDIETKVQKDYNIQVVFKTNQNVTWKATLTDPKQLLLAMSENEDIVTFDNFSKAHIYFKIEDVVCVLITEVVPPAVPEAVSEKVIEIPPQA